jgi:hypothetical protein
MPLDTRTRPPERVVSAPVDFAARTAGTSLRSLFGLVGRVRPTDKPLHPHGTVHRATVHRFGAGERFGVPWIDEPAQQDSLVRLSRAVGLPERLPDVLGIALRVGLHDSRAADLLFATTGRSRVGRFLLVPRHHSGGAFFSTLLPYRTRTGAVVLGAAVSSEVDAFDLLVARPSGPWQRFGTVVLNPDEPPHDAPVSFDPMLNALPELTPYGWVRSLREGAYAAARRSRRSSAG